MKKAIFYFFALSTLAIVLSFQACTAPEQLTKPVLQNSSKTEGGGSQEDDQGSLDGGGVPFDGKLTSTYQDRDTKFCEQQGSKTGLRTEIVKDKDGHWLSVEGCKAVSARLVDNEVKGSDASIKFGSLDMFKVNLAESELYERIKCYVANTDNLSVVVYESEKGLFLHYPRRHEVPNFIPVSAVHETGINYVKVYPTHNKVYTSSYKSAYWNDTYQGLFTLYLRDETQKETGGRWKLTLGNGQEAGNIGYCRIKPPRYHW